MSEIETVVPAVRPSTLEHPKIDIFFSRQNDWAVEICGKVSLTVVRPIVLFICKIFVQIYTIHSCSLKTKIDGIRFYTIYFISNTLGVLRFYLPFTCKYLWSSNICINLTTVNVCDCSTVFCLHHNFKIKQ